MLTTYQLTSCLYLRAILFSIFIKDIFHFITLFGGTNSMLITFYLESFIGPTSWCAYLFPQETVLEFCNLWTEKNFSIEINYPKCRAIKHQTLASNPQMNIKLQMPKDWVSPWNQFRDILLSWIKGIHIYFFFYWWHYYRWPSFPPLPPPPGPHNPSPCPLPHVVCVQGLCIHVFG